MTLPELVFRVHAVRRMFARNISEQDVRNVISAGETIEHYQDDKPYPSRLVSGWAGSRPLHAVVADNTDDNEIIVITAYEPTPELWALDFTKRRKS